HQLRDDPSRADREHLIAGLVASPMPLRPLLLEWFRRSTPAVQRALLEIATRRYYRIRELKHLQTPDDSALLCCVAEFDEPDAQAYLGVAFGDLATVAELTDSVTGRLEARATSSTTAHARGVLDFHLWTDQPLRGIDEVE